MKWIRTVLIIVFLLNNLFSYDLKKADFTTFCNYVSYTIGKNIIISQGVPTSFSVFMPYDRMTPDDLKRNFFIILKSKGLNYSITKDTILIFKDNSDLSKLKLSSSVIRFTFVPKAVISKYLKLYYPGVKFFIFQNRLIVTSTKDNIKKIKYLIKNLMSSYLQAKINFLITVLDNKKAKEVGSSLSIKNPFKHLLFSIVSDSVSVSNTLPSGGYFSSFLTFLNSKGISQTISKPTLNLIDGSNYTLESVHNIPYVEKTISVDKDGNPITQTQIKYKDIGLKIYIKNVYITKNNIDFDMDIYVQNIISLDKNIPVTDTKHFNTHIELTKKNSSYLLAGLRSVTKISNSSNVPVLSRLPLIGLLFKNKKSDIEDLSFAFYISTNFFEDKKCK